MIMCTHVCVPAEARKAREAEMKSRAQQLLMGKLGSLVRSKPPLHPSVAVTKPPLPRSAAATHHAGESPKPSLSPGGSPVRRPLHVNGGRQEERRNVPVIKPYLVKKGEKVEEKEKDTRKPFIYMYMYVYTWIYSI